MVIMHLALHGCVGDIINTWAFSYVYDERLACNKIRNANIRISGLGVGLVSSTRGCLGLKYFPEPGEMPGEASRDRLERLREASGEWARTSVLASTCR